MSKTSKDIVEKRLGIKPDYQYQALRGGIWLQANWHRNKLRAIEWAVDFTPSTVLLDLGTGSGNFVLETAKKVKRVVGADYNDEALKFLRNKLDEQNIRNVDLKWIDLRNSKELTSTGKFDVIVMADVIEHVDIKDGQKLAYDLYSMLNPNGRVCIITPNYKSWWIFLEALLDKVSAVPKLAGEQHLAKYDFNNLRQIFETAGFSTERLTTFNSWGWLLPGERLATAITKVELATGLRGGNLVLGCFTKPGR